MKIAKAPHCLCRALKGCNLVLRSAIKVGRMVATAGTPYFWMEDFASIQTGGANARHCAVITFCLHILMDSVKVVEDTLPRTHQS